MSAINLGLSKAVINAVASLHDELEPTSGSCASEVVLLQRKCSFATSARRRGTPATGGEGMKSAGQPWLVADIGGTNARFGWVAAGEDSVSHVAKLPVADHDGPASAARAYLAA